METNNYYFLRDTQIIVKIDKTRHNDYAVSQGRLTWIIDQETFDCDYQPLTRLHRIYYNLQPGLVALPGGKLEV